MYMANIQWMIANQSAITHSNPLLIGCQSGIFAKYGHVYFFMRPKRKKVSIRCLMPLAIQ
jgi:hypothetical protein